MIVQNERGIATLLIVTILGAAALMFGIFCLQSAQQSFENPEYTQLAERFSNQVVATNIGTVLMNGSSYARTVQDSANQSLTCVRNHSFCPNQVGAIPKLMMGNGTVYFDSVSQTFDRHGRVVTKTPATQAYDLTWRPTCVTGCVNPTVRVIFGVLGTGKKRTADLDL